MRPADAAALRESITAGDKIGDGGHTADNSGKFAALSKRLSYRYENIVTAGTFRRMAVRVDRINERLAAVGLKAQRASLNAGLSKDAIRNIQRGSSVNGRSDTLVRIAHVLDCSVAYLLGEAEEPGEAPGPLGNAAVEPDYLPVRYEVGAGYWVTQDDTQIFDRTIAVAPRPAYEGHDQWLEKVIGDSMDLEFAPGTFVHVVDAVSIGYQPRHDDYVIIVSREQGGHKIERSIKQVSIPKRGIIELWPRSANPKWNTPLDVSKGAQDPDCLQVEIVGKVLSGIKTYG